MSLPYRVVQITPRKMLYDAVLAAGILAYLALFLAISLAATGRPDLPEAGALLNRGLASLAAILLHVVLAIGPLARLHSGFLPLLANRRHLGVATFLIACSHGILSTLVYHTGGAMNPVASVLLGNGQVFSLNEFPFEVFGVAVLLILAALAFTSHDFWIAYFGRHLWKRLHMTVYAAYILLLLHVGLGTLQNTGNPVRAALWAAGAAGLLWLHWAAACRERAADQQPAEASPDGWLRVCRPEEIPLNRAVIVSTPDERVAVFRHWRGISAISNVCAHQGGPLGEGEIEAGCVRCPWHGAIYFPHNGTSPPPFEKSVPTYNLRLHEGVVYLDPRPNEPGMAVDPLVIGQRAGAGGAPPIASSNLPHAGSGELS